MPAPPHDVFSDAEHLRAFAKPLGVRILVENIPNELSTPDRLVEFIRTAHFDDVGVCFDCGHAHMMGGVPEAFEIVKKHMEGKQPKKVIVAQGRLVSVVV